MTDLSFKSILKSKEKEEKIKIKKQERIEHALVCGNSYNHLYAVDTVKEVKTV